MSANEGQTDSPALAVWCVARSDWQTGGPFGTRWGPPGIAGDAWGRLGDRSAALVGRYERLVFRLASVAMQLAVLAEVEPQVKGRLEDDQDQE